MKLRSYEEVLEVLAENNIGAKELTYKYRFFKELERSVYNGSKASTFRSVFDLPRPSQVIPSFTSDPATRTVGKSGQEVFIPYWEIHYYKQGFTSLFKTDDDQWFSSAGDEQHFYFTLRSKITDEHYEKLKKSGIILKSPKSTEQLVSIGFSNCKINKNYTGKPKDQTVTVSIYILEDENDNFDDFKLLITPEIWDCLTNKGENIPKYKPSELPHMMFLSYSSNFSAKTENVDSIVCMDRFTDLRSNEVDGVLKIKGNVYMNESSFVSLSRYGGKTTETYLGKNTIFGIGSAIRSVHVGDYVVVAERVDVDVYTELKDGCLITEGAKITECQEILPGQKVTATVPLCLNLMRNDRGFFLNDFLRMSENRHNDYVKGTLFS